jgi:hypothetical protein
MEDILWWREVLLLEMDKAMYARRQLAKLIAKSAKTV